jgi:hypothetical protein
MFLRLLEEDFGEVVPEQFDVLAIKPAAAQCPLCRGFDLPPALVVDRHAAQFGPPCPDVVRQPHLFDDLQCRSTHVDRLTSGAQGRRPLDDRDFISLAPELQS